jgi:hypothetical protein
MKKTFLIVLLLLSCVFIFAQLNPWLWAKKAGGTSDDHGQGIGVDASGNSYITGYFQGTATFGSTNLTSNGGYDIFVAKLDSSGNWLWAKNAGGTGSDECYGIAVDDSGNSYVTGCFQGSAIFGSTTLTSNGSYDIFIAKLDSSGNWLWAKNAGGPNYDSGCGIAFDTSGNSYVTGTFYSSADFGSTTLTSYGDYDIFIAKLDSSGNWFWAKNAGGTNVDIGYGIAVDTSGNSYVIGYFESGIVIFGPTTYLISSGYSDLFIAKLDSSGYCLWAQKAGGTSDDYGYGIVVDASGNSYVTGDFYSATATFGSTTLTNTSSGYYCDIFIAKLNSSGNWLWAKNAGGTGSDRGLGIAVDASGNSYVTGGFEGTATFGSNTLISNGYYDIFIAKLDSSGNWLWVKNAGGTNTDGGCSIAVDASRNSYVTGYFEGTSAAGSTFGNITIYGSGASSNDDIFFTKVRIPYYPENVPIVEETYSVPVTVTGGDADRGTLDSFPPVPDQSATYKKFNFILDNSIPNWTITMQTSDTYGAYYQNNNWNVVNGNGTEIVFNINFSGSKVAVELPIILSPDISNDENTTPAILATELQPIYPNPFNPIAYIPYTLETKSEVKINIYNTRGQVVKTFDLGTQKKGHHRITWDGRDNDGNLSGNGIYYIVMKAGKERFQRKAVLMK